VLPLRHAVSAMTERAANASGSRTMMMRYVSRPRLQAIVNAGPHSKLREYTPQRDK
jgi:hypothetical protein